MKTTGIILRSVIATLIVGGVITIYAAVSKGTHGLIGALFGVTIVVIFFTLGQVALDRVIQRNPMLATNFALLLYLVKVGVLFALLLAFKDTKAFDTKVFALTIVACTVTWLVAETWAFATSKPMYVEPGAGPDVMPIRKED